MTLLAKPAGQGPTKCNWQAEWYMSVTVVLNVEAFNRFLTFRSEGIWGHFPMVLL